MYSAVTQPRPKKRALYTGSKGQWQSYDCLNRKVLSLDLNVSKDGAFLTWSGRLFHAVGPETEKEQSPNLATV